MMVVKIKVCHKKYNFEDNKYCLETAQLEKKNKPFRKKIILMWIILEIKNL